MPKLNVDTSLIETLAELLQRTGLTEIEISEGDARIRVARELQQVVQMPQGPRPAPPRPGPPKLLYTPASRGFPSGMRGVSVGVSVTADATIGVVPSTVTVTVLMSVAPTDNV